ncbi:DUF1992 domain-containing protein [Oceanobacillus halophilus]|nr:DUF1992 domain-containing protein [Oceanobacillus halophilus]
MTAIIRNAEREGQFDYLPGKGKPLKMAGQSIQSEERQLYKTLKDNHILPKWVKLAKEIDILKEELKQTAGREKRKLVKEVNKKIREYNYACPPSLQKRKVVG